MTVLGKSDFLPWILPTLSLKILTSVLLRRQLTIDLSKLNLATRVIGLVRPTS